jgi:hypothetical protein
MMAITPDNVAGMRYAAQIPKKATTPKPKAAATPKPKSPAPKAKAPTVPKPISSTLAKLEQEGTDATAAINAAMTEGDIAAAAGDVEAATANNLLKESQTSLSSEDIAKLVKQYTTESINAMNEAQKTEERLSAFNILRMEFEQYGLGSLVTDIKDLLMNNTPPSEFSLRLRGTEAYQDRFKANEARISAGLAALSPAEYVALEDQYQNVMRNYGLPATYYTKDKTGKQAGFEKFIAGDVSATELETRIVTAQDRVLNANPEVSAALKAFYPDITNGDILAYTLDPQNALKNIQTKVTTAEIQGAANVAGLNKITADTTPEQIKAMEARAAALAGYGVTKARAQEGFQAVAEVAPRGGQLAEIYKEQPYGQVQAEQEVFGLAGSTEAKKRREKLAGLEQAAFSKRSGAAQGALQRERAGNL